MRWILVGGVSGFLCVSCATQVPGYRYDREAACGTRTAVKGMHRVHPSAEDVNAIWQSLDLKPSEHIHYWFEDDAGNVLLGVTDRTNDWEVELVKSGPTYTVKTLDWRQQQIV